MRRSTRFFCLSMLALLAVSAGVACSDDDDGASEQEGEANLCSDLEELQTALVDFGGTLSLSSSVDDVRAARDEAADAFEQVRESARDVADIRIDEFETAWEEFADAIENVAESGSIGDALSTIRTAADELGTAYTEAFGGLDCP